MSDDNSALIGQAAAAVASGRDFHLIVPAGQDSPTIGEQIQKGATAYGAKTSSPDIVGTINADGSWSANPDSPVQQEQIGSGASITSGASDWLQSHAANVGLVVFGALLVIGALLISQKDNITAVVTKAGELSAVG